MNEQEVLDILLQVAKTHKEIICKQNGGPAEGMPCVLGLDTDDTPFIVPDHFDGHPTDTLPVVLSTVYDGLKEQKDSARWNWLGYVVEAYMKPDATDAPERGTYQQEYMNNPNTDIRECLVITMIPWEGVLKCASIPYGYGDDGMPVWEEPQIGDEQDGLIPFIFETFREFCLRDGEVS